MTNIPDIPTDRLRDTSRYQPSPEEQVKAAQLVEKLMPSLSEYRQYRQYRAMVDSFLSMVGSAIQQFARKPGRMLTF
jgi:hypothetical protein